MINNIVLKKLTTIEELQSTTALEQEIWGNNSTLPVHQKLTAVNNGGLVLGAYLKNQLVGFQYSFAGFNGIESYLCSHMLGVIPRYRHFGIGELLKNFQKEEARKLGYNLIVWTYDPLESANGYLNIGKLGAICSTYIENCYGEMKDPLNMGLASDRFKVMWWINSEKTKSTLLKEPNGIEKILINQVSCDNLFAVIKKVKFINSPKVYVAIPSNFQEMKRVNLSLAIDWRIKTREIFQHYFAKGWVVIGFVKAQPSTNLTHYYVLEKKERS